MIENDEDDDSDFDSLMKTALKNAMDDRDRAVEAFNKTKDIYNINLEAPEDGENQSSNLQGLMLIGQNVSKLLEISLKSNDQIIKLAQLRKEKKIKSDTKSPFNFDDLKKLRDGQSH